MSPAVKIEESGRFSVSIPAAGLMLALIVGTTGAAGWFLAVGTSRGIETARLGAVELRAELVERRVANVSDDSTRLREVVIVNTQRLKTLEDALDRINLKLDKIFDRLDAQKASK